MVGYVFRNSLNLERKQSLICNSKHTEDNMTLFLIVLIVFLCVWFNDADKRAKKKTQKIEEKKRQENINISLQDVIEKKYFDLILDALRKADRAKRLYLKEILDVIEFTYDKYGIPYEHETWLSGKTRTQYREDNYREYKKDTLLNFGFDYDKLDETEFFNHVSLEQLIFNDSALAITKFASSNYLIGEPNSRCFFDKSGKSIRTCSISTCEHHKDSYPSAKCMKCTEYTSFLDYDCSGRSEKLLGYFCGNRTRSTAVRLIAEFVSRATKKELYQLGYSYSFGRFDAKKHQQITSVPTQIEADIWMYKNPPINNKKS